LCDASARVKITMDYDDVLLEEGAIIEFMCSVQGRRLVKFCVVNSAKEELELGNKKMWTPAEGQSAK